MGAFAHEAVISRALVEAADMRNYALYADHLSAEGTSKFGVKILSRAVAEEFQVKSVSKMVMNICRTGGTESELKGAFGDLRRFLARISEVNFISTEFQDEVDKLRKILGVSLDLDSKVLAELETLKVEFFNNRSGGFHKPMTLLPTSRRTRPWSPRW